jgi:AcrR family transcriptional regulator
MNKMPEIKNRILIEATALFMQFGLKSVSMDDIAAKMGVSKKTLYLHFQDKEQMVIDVVKKITGENKDICDADRKRASNAIHEIFLAIEQMSKLFHHMNSSVLFDLQKYYPLAYKIHTDYKKEYLLSVIKENLIRGINEGLYRSDINIEILSLYRVESIVIPFYPEFQKIDKTNMASIAEELSFHFLYGIVSTKGLKQMMKYTQSSKK